MKVALIQLNACDDKTQNIKRAIGFVRRAIHNKADFILLPEVFHFRGSAQGKNSIHSAAETIPGESLKPLAALAKQHKVFILAGSIYERIPGSKKVYNISVLINDKGKITARYRKMHLFDALIGKKVVKESLIFRAGRRPALGRVKGFKVGLSICYDLRFPDLYKDYVRRGAEILCIPSAFTRATGQAHWEVLLRARAIENLCYVLAPNQTGENANGVFAYGHSLIVDPWGKVLAEASADKEELIYATINPKVLTQTRRKLPAIT